MKYDSFSTYAWNLGIYNQGFWITVNLDSVFYYTCELHLIPSGSFFGIYFSSILYHSYISTTYSRESSSYLVAYSILISLSAIPVYKIVQSRV